MGALLLFVANALLAIGQDPNSYTRETEFALLAGIWILGVAVGGCFLLAVVFRNRYHEDDAALIKIDEDNG